MLSIVGIPVGLWLTDRVPNIMTLRPEYQLRTHNMTYLLQGPQQALAVIGLPITFWMLGQVDRVAAPYSPEASDIG